MGMAGPMNGACSGAPVALARLDRRLWCGPTIRVPVHCAKPAPGTPTHRRWLCAFNAGLDHWESGRSGQVARVPDSEGRRHWRPSWLRMRPCQ